MFSFEIEFCNCVSMSLEYVLICCIDLMFLPLFGKVESEAILHSFVQELFIMNDCVSFRVSVCCPVSIEVYFSHRWADFEERWRVAGYTMRKYESQKLV